MLIVRVFFFACVVATCILFALCIISHLSGLAHQDIFRFLNAHKDDVDDDFTLVCLCFTLVCCLFGVQAPEFFYKMLEKKLQIRTLSGLMSFTEALSDLPST